MPITGPQTEQDLTGQIAALENAVSQKSDAIVIAPSSFTGLGHPVDEAAKSVPIIAVDSKADSKAFTSLLTTNNEIGGKMGGEALAKAIEKASGKAEGEVAVISFGPGASTLDERIKGFKEGIAAYPGLKLVTVRVGDFQTTTALNDTVDVMTAFPNLKGVFADALFTGLGAGQAIAEAKNGGKIQLVSFDSSDQLVNYVKDGVAQALIVQDPFKMGYEGVETADKVVKGGKVADFIDTGANLITKENLGTPRSKELLSPDLDSH